MKEYINLVVGEVFCINCEDKSCLVCFNGGYYDIFVVCLYLNGFSSFFL